MDYGSTPRLHNECLMKHFALDAKSRSKFEISLNHLYVSLTRLILELKKSYRFSTSRTLTKQNVLIFIYTVLEEKERRKSMLLNRIKKHEEAELLSKGSTTKGKGEYLKKKKFKCKFTKAN